MRYGLIRMAQPVAPWCSAAPTSTSSMLTNGVRFPVLPETPEIMHIIVPDMLQNALTGKMIVEAAKDAAAKVRELHGGM